MTNYRLRPLNIYDDFYLSHCIYCRIQSTNEYVFFLTDYDAPLSEAGDLTNKYNATTKLIQDLVLGKAILLANTMQQQN